MQTGHRHSHRQTQPLAHRNAVKVDTKEKLHLSCRRKHRCGRVCPGSRVRHAKRARARRPGAGAGGARVGRPISQRGEVFLLSLLLLSLQGQELFIFFFIVFIENVLQGGYLSFLYKATTHCRLLKLQNRPKTNTAHAAPIFEIEWVGRREGGGNGKKKSRAAGHRAQAINSVSAPQHPHRPHLAVAQPSRSFSFSAAAGCDNL